MGEDEAVWALGGDVPSVEDKNLHALGEERIGKGMRESRRVAGAHAEFQKARGCLRISSVTCRRPF